MGIQLYTIVFLGILLIGTGAALRYQMKQVDRLEIELKTTERALNMAVKRSNDIIDARKTDIKDIQQTADRNKKEILSSMEQAIDICYAQVEHYKKKSEDLRTRNEETLPCAVRIDSGGLLSNISKASQRASSNPLPGTSRKANPN